ncbi:MAG: cation-translocating P-type ATPase [Bradymonadaceae bacterium]
METYAGRRVHIELRALDRDDFEAFADELAVSLERLDGVELFDRVVVAYRSPLTGPVELVRVVEGVEVDCGVDSVALPERCAEFPGGPDRRVRQWTELVADLLGAALGAGLKIVEREPRDAEFDLAAFFSILEDFPQIRQRVEGMTGPDVFELLTGGIDALIQAIGSGPVGPIVDMLHQIATIRGVGAQRRAWFRVEARMRPDGERRVSPPMPDPERPCELPEGPVESYTDEAWFASIGGFIVAVADTHALEPATAPMFGGLPKAARYGRDGFAGEMLRVLADRGVLVLEPAALRRLDRVDTLVVDGGLVDEDRGAVELLITVARRIGASVALTGPDAERARQLEARSLETQQTPPVEEIRQMQTFGACVMAVGCFEPAALRAADVAVGIAGADSPIPWAADIVGGELDDAVFVAEAIDEAHSLAEQSVHLAEAGATLGALVSLRGVEETNLDSVKLAVHAAAVTSLGNGIAKVLAFEHRPRPTAPDPTPWHALPAGEVLERLETDRHGLGGRQLVQRRRPQTGEPSRWTMARRALTEELANPMTPLLGAATAASAVLGSMIDAAMVGSVVSVNAALGGFERYRAQRAMSALAEREAPRVGVRREGTVRRVDADELVWGDIVVFEAGDVVPADCRILEATDLEVDESALTGESVPVRKSAGAVDAERVQNRTSMLYAGTAVVGGNAVGAVVATGGQTEARRRLGIEVHPDRETGVEQRLSELTDITVPLAGTAGAFMTAMGLRRGRNLETLVDTGIGMAVAAIPEGLPLLATAAQLASARRLSDYGVVVRNPRALEAIGRIDILCADKTGTLTEGRIRLGVISDGARRVELEADTGGSDERWVESALVRALRASPPHTDEQALPHPTDRAIVEGARERGLEAAGREGEWRRVDELKFHPRRGYHGVLGETAAGQRIIVKGAPERILELCTHTAPDGERCELDEAGRDRLLTEAEQLASDGLRVLCLAERTVDSRESLEEADVEGLTFHGLLGLRDPARSTAAVAVERLAEAGIRTMMITGDHPNTARRIACDVGLTEPDVLTGLEIEEMSDEQLESVLPETTVIARATPTQKSRIVEALQNAGQTIGMAGDGANDASAIRLAEVGLAVGPDATAAARDAADVVLLDENIETMVRTVAEGRTMLESVRDAVAILAGGNFGEIGFSVLGSLVDSQSPLNARQLLLVNLMTDIAPSMAMALRHPEVERLDRLMRQDPTDLMGGQLDRALAIRAGATASGAGLAWGASRCLPGGDRRRDSTVALLALVGSQLGQTIFLGNPTRETIWAGLGSVGVLLATVMIPGLSQLFGSCPVGPIGLSVATGSSAMATGAAAFAERFAE